MVQTAIKAWFVSTLAICCCLLNAQALDPEARLARARSTWGITRPASYQYTLRFQGTYPPPFPHAVIFRVMNGRSARVTEIDDRWRAFFDPFDSIDKLFAFIEAKLKARPAKATIEYDLALGYPMNVFIDPQARVADDEIVFQVTDFDLSEGQRRTLTLELRLPAEGPLNPVSFRDGVRRSDVRSQEVRRIRRRS